MSTSAFGVDHGSNEEISKLVSRRLRNKRRTAKANREAKLAAKYAPKQVNVDLKVPKGSGKAAVTGAGLATVGGVAGYKMAQKKKD